MFCFFGKIVRTRPKGRVFSSRGFTMVELVVVIIILGILAAVAAPKFFSAGKFEEMGFADAAANAIRYANKLALASGCDTRVVKESKTINGQSRTVIALYQRQLPTPVGANTCNTSTLAFAQKVKPGSYSSDDSTHWLIVFPNRVSMTSPAALDIYFDNKGKPHDILTAGDWDGSKNPLVIAGSGSSGQRQINIEPETGYVWQTTVTP